MNEYYSAAGQCGLFIAIAWAVAPLISLIIQTAVAWIDDSDRASENWVVHTLYKKTHKYRYPVYNGASKEVFGYAKDKKHSGAKSSSLRIDENYVFSHDAGFFYPISVAVVGGIPFAVVAAFDFYPITLSILGFVVMAHMARFGRRHQKLFTKHIEDKNAHR